MAVKFQRSGIYNDWSQQYCPDNAQCIMPVATEVTIEVPIEFGTNNDVLVMMDISQTTSTNVDPVYFNVNSSASLPPALIADVIQPTSQQQLKYFGKTRAITLQTGDVIHFFQQNGGASLNVTFQPLTP